MLNIKRKLKELLVDKDESKGSLTQKHLEDDGLKGIELRRYQLDGVSWMKRCFLSGHGCILGDEMGLGKTIQTIALLTNLQGSENCSGPFLVVCPLSVLQNWKSEFCRFSKSQNVFNFIGDKDEREELKETLKDLIDSQHTGINNASLSSNVILTTYEMCLRETSFLSKFYWKAMIVDEAHRLKNFKSALYQELSQFEKDFVVLLTGTPIQNNLKELYSLLSFVSPSIFVLEAVEEFVERYSGVDDCAERNLELQDLLSPFLLRRVKSEVMAHLPKKTEVLLYTGMSEIQKKYYKAILMKDFDAFNSLGGNNRTRLMNVLIQLRKCVNHPYLFDGVEPEPFELGEHLIDASGKLQVIDQLLIFLKTRGHKVLMFSQMTRMLDIIQDYLGYRGYCYERLDGSVRGEERYLAIQNFNETEDTFIFLLSTRAGGQGLNLMSADTVIFLDSDFNPQNDLQAAARAHRIGQTRPVKIIRLVGRSTVEEIVLKRADEKLKLTNTVIEGGKFSGSASAVNQIAETPTQLADMLKFGLDKLFDSEESTVTEKDLERVLGGSCNNEWILEETGDKSSDAKDDIGSHMETDEGEKGKVSSMYVYEGHDYSKGTSARDQQAFDNMMADVLNEAQSEERLLRSERKSSATQYADLPARKRKVLTPEELEDRRRKREENAAKRAKLKEEEELRKETERQRKLEKLWKDNNYISLNAALDDDEEDEETNLFDENNESDRKDIHYVRGDVTHPMNTRGSDAIIVHCVDDSGRWGQGGLFSALSRRSLQPETQYELASKMKDLKLGDAHLIPVDDKGSRQDGHDYVALIVAQSRDRKNRLSGIQLTGLSQGLKRVAMAAKKMKATIHLPRIGYNTPSFNWYGTERLVRKHLASKGIETSIYYFARRQQPTTSTNNSPTSASVKNGKSSEKNKTPQKGSPSWDVSTGGAAKASLPDFMYGVNVFFQDVDDDQKKRLSRYLIAYNGDVSQFVGKGVTHVVCDNYEEVNFSFQEPITGLKIVSLKWLENCFRKGRILDTQPYEIRKTTGR